MSVLNSEYELEETPHEPRRRARLIKLNYDPQYEQLDEAYKDVSSRHRGYLGTAFILTYVLLFFAGVATLAATIVFLKTRHKSGSLLSNQSLTMLTDTCDSSLHSYNLLANLLVNFIGTIIMASSNYLQQICASPTVEFIARELRRGKDWKFGSNSPRAVLRQTVSLSLFWLLLVLTSVPLHIMINGIVGYAVHSVNASSSAIPAPKLGQPTAPPYAQNWTVVSSEPCAALLLSSLAYVTDFNNITIVVNENSTAPLSFYNNYLSSGYQSSYVAVAHDIELCYVNYIVSQCELTVRWVPLFCSAIALLIKSIIAFIIVRRHNHFRRRVFNCLGDMITLGARHPWLRTFVEDGNMFKGQPCRLLRIPWRKALDGWDMSVVIFWWISAVSIAGLGVFEWERVGKEMTIGDRFKRFGLGTIDPLTSIPGGTNYQDESPNTFPIQVLIANCPQLWLSIGYLLWNNQISRIWMEMEWRSFYHKREVPRVSYDTPGEEESGVKATRWLQLPYWMTFILISLNTMLHWLVSQTLFVVEILASPQRPATFYLNFSPLAIMCVGLAVIILVLGITIYYFIPKKTWMPLMAGSVRVVFESCQLLETTMPRGGIMWGDISTDNRRLAGFAPVTNLLVPGAYYPSNRLLEPRHIQSRGSMLSPSVASRVSDLEPLLQRQRRY
jgi:hypothetical protein